MGWQALAARLERDIRWRLDAPEVGSEDEEGWRLLRERVRAYAGVILDRLDASWRLAVEDVVQEVVLRLQAPERLARLRVARAPAGYVAALIHNTALNLVRRVPPLVKGPGALDLHSADEAGETAPDPDELVLASQIYEGLSPAERQLVELRFWDDFSVQEIADRLGITYSAAAVRLSRLLRRLRRELDPGEPV